jgi:hypothetical protein
VNKTEKKLLEAAKAEHRLYRKVFFGSEEGKLVFGRLLEKLGHFKQAENERERYLKDFATHLLNVVMEGNGVDYVKALATVRDHKEEN